MTQAKLRKSIAGIGTGKTACSQRKEKAERKETQAENHHKYIMGGIIVKYFPDCYRYDEGELNLLKDGR